MEFQAQIVPLGPHWNALVFSDGSIILQYRSGVIYAPTGNVLDLNDSRLQSALEDSSLDSRLIVTRAIALHQDGSVHVDPHGVSPGGLPSDEAFPILDSLIQSVRRCDINLLDDLVSSVSG